MPPRGKGRRFDPSTFLDDALGAFLTGELRSVGEGAANQGIRYAAAVLKRRFTREFLELMAIIIDEALDRPLPTAEPEKNPSAEPGEAPAAMHVDCACPECQRKRQAS